jgi:hypothetical protein
MGIGSGWKKRRQRAATEAMHEAEEQSYESPEERQMGSTDMPGRGADEIAARGVHEATIEDADRLSDF